MLGQHITSGGTASTPAHNPGDLSCPRWAPGQVARTTDTSFLHIVNVVVGPEIQGVFRHSVGQPCFLSLLVLTSMQEREISTTISGSSSSSSSIILIYNLIYLFFLSQTFTLCTSMQCPNRVGELKVER